jgi:cytochrome c oxidase cbb3-type subunit 1/cytochrome c oxidase cbb3-type subunit I/II
LCVAALAGFLSAVQLFAPDVIRNVGELQMGRVRPVHVNLALLGFVVSLLLGAGLYIVPILLRTRLYSERLANFAMVLHNLAMVGTVVTLAMGLTQGREYAELIFPVKALLIAELLLLLYVLLMTVFHRRENLLYVSVWYVVGGVLWTVIVYPLGNVIWRPESGALDGVVDAILLWFYGHNVLGLFLTPLAIGVAYYVIPRVAKAPLYSHTLSLIGFWTFIGLYSHIGAHHLLQAPVPLWLKTISVIDSVAMVVPVLTVLVNLWMTSKDNLGDFVRSIPGRFVFVGTLWYLVACIQGPLHSLPSVQYYVHFNNWVVGHAHIAVLGFSGLIALGGLWYVLPQVSGRRIYSMTLLNSQFWLVLVGLSGFAVVLTVAGLVQGTAWASGATVYRALPLISPYMGLRLAFGILIILGAFAGLYNVVMTLTRGERVTSCE